MLCYLIRLNGEAKYVGLTKKVLKKRWAGHQWDAKNRTNNSVLHASMRKHGVDAFTIEPIAYAPDFASLKQLEVVLIAHYKTRAPHGYNLTDGGDGLAGVVRSAETVAKIVAKVTGQKRTPEQRAALSLAQTGCLKGPMSDEHRTNLSAAKRGKPQNPVGVAKRTGVKYNMTPEGRAAQSETGKRNGAAQKGRKHTPEQCAANSERKRGVKQSEETVAKRIAKTKGKKRTPEQRAKMKAGQIARRQAERDAKTGNQ